MADTVDVYMIWKESTREFCVDKTPNLLQQIRLHYNAGSMKGDIRYAVLAEDLGHTEANKLVRYYLMDPPSPCEDYKHTRKLVAGMRLTSYARKN